MCARVCIRAPTIPSSSHIGFPSQTWTRDAAQFHPQPIWTLQATTKGILAPSNGFPLSLHWSKAFVILPKMPSIKGFNQDALWYVFYSILFGHWMHFALMLRRWLNLYESSVCGSPLFVSQRSHHPSSLGQRVGARKGSVLESVSTRNISFSKGHAEVNCWTLGVPPPPLSDDNILCQHALYL